MSSNLNKPMEDALNGAFNEILNTGLVGALFVIAMIYIIYAEKHRKANIHRLLSEFTKNNSDSVEELKALEKEYREHLKLTLKECFEKLKDFHENACDK